eukprot:213838-Chlamydomonas_euryale.AAC.7
MQAQRTKPCCPIIGGWPAAAPCIVRALAMRTTSGRSDAPVGSGSTCRMLNARMACSAAARVVYHTNAEPFDWFVALSFIMTSSTTGPMVSKNGSSCSSLKLAGMLPTNSLSASLAQPTGTGSFTAMPVGEARLTPMGVYGLAMAMPCGCGLRLSHDSGPAHHIASLTCGQKRRGAMTQVAMSARP